MAGYYDLTPILNGSNDIGQMAVNTNNAMNMGGMENMLGISILLSIFFVLFISMKYRNMFTKDAFAVTSFITTIIAILFFSMGFVDGKTLFISILATAISVAILVFPREANVGG